MKLNEVKISGLNLVSYIIFIILLVLFIVSKFRYLNVPLDRDEGTYLYMGRMFLDGYRPYIDFYEIKPPGIFFIYGIFDAIFGASNIFLHAGIFLLQLVTAFLIYKITSCFFKGKQQALTASGVYFLFVIFPNFQGFGILSEHFFIFFILLSLYFSTKVSPTKISKYALLSGLSLGMAAMIRQHAVFFILPFALFMIYRTIDLKINWKSFFFYFIAGNFITITALIIYVIIRSGVDEMVYWTITHPSENYVQALTWEKGRSILLNYFNNIVIKRYWPLLILFSFGLVVLLKNAMTKKNRGYSLFLLLFFFASFACIFPGFRFYGHYWLMTFPAISIIVGFSILTTEDKFFQYVSAFVIGLLIISQIYINSNLYFKAKTELVYKKLYGTNPNTALNIVTQSLNRKLREKDQIFVFGSEPQVYYQTGKILKIPHVYISFLHSPAKKSKFFQKEVIDYLITNKPEYIVHIQNSISINLRDESVLDLYNWIFSFEINHYTPIILAETDPNNSTEFLYDQQAQKTPQTDNYIVVYKLNK